MINAFYFIDNSYIYVLAICTHYRMVIKGASVTEDMAGDKGKQPRRLLL